MRDTRNAPNDTPERRMFGAVLIQAMQDAFFQTDQCTKQDSERATSFLTDRKGPHAEGRRFYCDALGLDDDGFREYVIAVLNGEIEPRSFYSADQLSKRSDVKLAAARERWVKPPTPTTTPRKHIRTRTKTKTRPCSHYPEVPIVDGVWATDTPIDKSRLGNVTISQKGSRQRNLLDKLLRGITQHELDTIPKAACDLYILRTRFHAEPLWRDGKAFLSPA